MHYSEGESSTPKPDYTKKRISREELVGLVRPEVEKGVELPIIEFKRWGTREIQLIRDFRAQHPDISLDDKTNPIAKEMRMQFMGLIDGLHSHISGMNDDTREKLENWRDKAIEDFFRKLLLKYQPEILIRANSELKSTYPDVRQFSEDSTASEIVQFLYHIPRDTLADILLALGETYEVHSPIDLKKVKSSLEACIDSTKSSRDSLIPIDVKDRVDTVGSQVKLTFVSMMQTFSDRLFIRDYDRDFTGQYNMSNYGVSLYHITGIDYTLTNVLTHEYVHALSSHRAVRVDIATDDIKGTIGFKEYDRRRWLNEAVTESIAGEIIDSPENKRSYQNERHLLQLILTKGSGVKSDGLYALGVNNSLVPEKLITEAYFEDRDPSQPATQQRSKQKEFIQAINNLYSPGFLNRLDSVVQFLGLKVAIAIMEQPNFDPKNDQIPHLRDDSQALEYKESLKAKGVIK